MKLHKLGKRYICVLCSYLLKYDIDKKPKKNEEEEQKQHLWKYKI